MAIIFGQRLLDFFVVLSNCYDSPGRNTPTNLDHISHRFRRKTKQNGQQKKLFSFRQRKREDNQNECDKNEIKISRCYNWLNTHTAQQQQRQTRTVEYEMSCKYMWKCNKIMCHRFTFIVSVSRQCTACDSECVGEREREEGGIGIWKNLSNDCECHQGRIVRACRQWIDKIELIQSPTPFSSVQRQVISLHSFHWQIAPSEWVGERLHVKLWSYYGNFYDLTKSFGAFQPVLMCLWAFDFVQQNTHVVILIIILLLLFVLHRFLGGSGGVVVGSVSGTFRDHFHCPFNASRSSLVENCRHIYKSITNAPIKIIPG